MTLEDNEVYVEYKTLYQTRITSMLAIGDDNPHVLTFLLKALQTLIPMSWPDTGVTQNYTALSGEKIILPCPIEPGALLQYYSVIWMKKNVVIATANSQNSRTTSSKYDIDRATYSLIIDPMSVNDTSPSYQCQMYVHNPNTDTKQQLQYFPQIVSGVSLQLTVIGKLTCMN